MNIGRQTGFLTVWLVVTVAAVGWTRILLPPAGGSTDLALWLADLHTRPTDSWSVHLLLEAAGDTNVLPLLQVDDDPLSPRLHTQPGSRFVSRFIDRREVRYKHWSLFRGWGTAQSIQGTGDTGQLWLDLESETSRPGKRYDVGLTAEETKLSWWGLGREFRISAGRLGPVTGRIGIRWLNVFRHRRGRLTGWFENGDFKGDLILFSSRGIGFAATGRGYAVDLDLKGTFAPGWTVALRGEGLLGRVHWTRYRDLHAAVASTNVFQDPDGFLHNLPTASGTERRFAFSQGPIRVWEAAVARRQGAGQWILDWRSSGPPPTFRLYRVHRLGPRRYLLAGWDMNRSALGLTYSCPAATVTVHSSHLSLSNAFVGDLALELRCK